MRVSFMKRPLQVCKSKFLQFKLHWSFWNKCWLVRQNSRHQNLSTPDIRSWVGPSGCTGALCSLWIATKQQSRFWCFKFSVLVQVTLSLNQHMLILLLGNFIFVKHLSLFLFTISFLISFSPNSFFPTNMLPNQRK